jgi:hypothetical protein
MNYPEELMPGLAEVRATGCCNMFDFYCVLTVLRYQGYTDAANWLKQHQDNYLELLAGDFCAWIDSHPPLPRESIAQRVARETGLEVIKD